MANAFTHATMTPMNPKPGDIWSTGGGKLSTWTTINGWQDLPTQGVGITLCGEAHTISFTQIEKLANDAANLEALVEEQPAVKEAYETLQLLIKLYGNKNDEHTEDK